MTNVARNKETARIDRKVKQIDEQIAAGGDAAALEQKRDLLLRNREQAEAQEYHRERALGTYGAPAEVNPNP